MGTVYFDGNRRAHNSPATNTIASVDGEIWKIYCATSMGTDWDIIDGRFVSLKTSEEIQTAELKENKLMERNFALANGDWRMGRNVDELGLGLRPTDDRNSLIAYRQHLRHLPERENWWLFDIASYEEFIGIKEAE
ncbi:MAG: hypothetical protein LBI34_03220 [Puniceicoccales bacterium]|jgi:hypothetical protein|nr:hypothetical protein [Puniceicoccales bacterium]